MIDKKTVNIYNYFIGKTLNNREDINAMKIYINENQKKGTIAPEIYGHFSEHLGRCIYDGLYVGEESEIPNENGMRSDVVKALKDINIPVLRWPGGCFADEYHWKDGIGPKEKERKWSIRTGAVQRRITASVPMNISSSADNWAARLMYAAMSGAARYRK